MRECSKIELRCTAYDPMMPPRYRFVIKRKSDRDKPRSELILMAESDALETDVAEGLHTRVLIICGYKILYVCDRNIKNMKGLLVRMCIV